MHTNRFLNLLAIVVMISLAACSPAGAPRDGCRSATTARA